MSFSLGPRTVPQRAARVETGPWEAEAGGAATLGLSCPHRPVGLSLDGVPGPGGWTVGLQSLFFLKMPFSGYEFSAKQSCILQVSCFCFPSKLFGSCEFPFDRGWFRRAPLHFQTGGARSCPLSSAAPLRTQRRGVCPVRSCVTAGTKPRALGSVGSPWWVQGSGRWYSDLCTY